MRPPRLAALLVTVTILTGSLVGCSGGETTSTPSTTQPGRGGVLRVGVSRLDTLDPNRLDAASVGGAAVIDLVSDGLTRLDPESGEVLPEVAQSWSVDEAGTRWRFQLADRFNADGARVSAAAVAAALTERLDRLDPVVAVEAVDERTIGFRLSAPNHELPALLSGPELGVAPGPFSVTQPTSDGWRLTPTPGRAVRLDAVEVRRFPDDGAALEAFTEGALDWAPVPGARAATIPNVVRSSALAQVWLGMSVTAPGMSDLSIRRAVALAVDRRGAVEAAYGQDGSARPAEGLTPLLPWRSGGCGELCRNADAARATLAGRTPALRLVAADETPLRVLAEHLAGDLRSVGFTVEVAVLPAAAFGEEVLAGRAQLFLFGSVAESASPDPFLVPAFSGTGSGNATGIDSGTINEALGAARAEPDGGARVRRYRSAEDRILEAVVAVPVVDYQTLTVVSARVRGLVTGPRGTFDAAAVWLDA